MIDSKPAPTLTIEGRRIKRGNLWNVLAACRVDEDKETVVLNINFDKFLDIVEAPLRSEIAQLRSKADSLRKRVDYASSISLAGTVKVLTDELGRMTRMTATIFRRGTRT